MRRKKNNDRLRGRDSQPHKPNETDDPTFICECGYSGRASELDCEDDDSSIKCQVCGTAGWSF